MATLQELVPYLEKQYVIQNVRGESLRLIDSWVEWRHLTWSGRPEVEKCSLAQVSGIKDLWDYGVVFCDQQGKHPFIETEIARIDELIARGTPGIGYMQKEER